MTFSTEVVVHAIGVGLVWTAVLMYQHFRKDEQKSSIVENGASIDLKNDDGGSSETVVVHERYYYPSDIAHDIDDIDLPPRIKEEVLATAWEYSRTVIPEYTNWPRYVAFMRIIVMGITAEFRGSLMDVANDDNVVGYSLSGILDTLFKGTPGHEEMSREFRCFLLLSSQKSRHQTNTVLFRRYCVALSQGPWQYFRMRDTDALARFTIAAALACNDLDKVWFTDDQFDILAEIGNTMYDAVSYWKHRSEGETNSTFAYMPADERVMAFHKSREALWALDVAWKMQPEQKVVINFLRYFGGPLHLMMRRYRFVEEGLTLGKPESKRVIAQTRRNYKLWNQLDEQKATKPRELEGAEQYDHVLSQEKTLLFEGLAGMLDKADDSHCTNCWYRETYGAASSHAFGGVQLCDQCKEKWRAFAKSLFTRMVKCFPEVAETLRTSELRATSS